MQILFESLKMLLTGNWTKLVFESLRMQPVVSLKSLTMDLSCYCLSSYQHTLVIER